MDKSLTWYGYLLADGQLRCERLLVGNEPREDAVRVYGPIRAKSRLLAYRDLKVMHAAADPISPAEDEGLASGIEAVVSQYARIAGREAACELLAGLFVQLSDGGGYAEGGVVVDITEAPVKSSICSVLSL